MSIAQIRRFMFLFGPVSSIFDFVTFGIMYWLFAKNAAAFQTGWFMESLATQALVIFVIRTRKIPIIQSRPSIWLGATSLLVVVAGWSIALSPIGHIFGFTPLPVAAVFLLATTVVIYLFVVEGVKRIYQRMALKQAYVA